MSRSTKDPGFITAEEFTSKPNISKQLRTDILNGRYDQRYTLFKKSRVPDARKDHVFPERARVNFTNVYSAICTAISICNSSPDTPDGSKRVHGHHPATLLNLFAKHFLDSAIDSRVLEFLLYQLHIGQAPTVAGHKQAINNATRSNLQNRLKTHGYNDPNHAFGTNGLPPYTSAHWVLPSVAWQEEANKVNDKLVFAPIATGRYTPHDGRRNYVAGEKVAIDVLLAKSKNGKSTRTKKTSANSGTASASNSNSDTDHVRQPAVQRGKRQSRKGNNSVSGVSSNVTTSSSSTSSTQSANSTNIQRQSGKKKGSNNSAQLIDGILPDHLPPGATYYAPKSTRFTDGLSNTTVPWSTKHAHFILPTATAATPPNIRGLKFDPYKPRANVTAASEASGLWKGHGKDVLAYGLAVIEWCNWIPSAYNTDAAVRDYYDKEFPKNAQLYHAAFEAAVEQTIGEMRQRTSGQLLNPSWNRDIRNKIDSELFESLVVMPVQTNPAPATSYLTNAHDAGGASADAEDDFFDTDAEVENAADGTADVADFIDPNTPETIS